MIEHVFDLPNMIGNDHNELEINLEYRSTLGWGCDSIILFTLIPALCARRQNGLVQIMSNLLYRPGTTI